MKIIAYLRVSTPEQADTGAGLDAQRAAVTAEAERRGWTEVDYIEDAGYSAKSMNRPGLAAALKALDEGAAETLVVAKLDRLSRSMLDFARIVASAQKRGWGIVALDVAVDTTTPAGEVMMNVMAAFAQFERRLIGQRTKDALAAKREAGVRLGRPRAISSKVERRIRSQRAEGMTLQGIANALDAEGIATTNGGPWRPSTLARVLARTPA